MMKKSSESIVRGSCAVFNLRNSELNGQLGMQNFLVQNSVLIRQVLMKRQIVINTRKGKLSKA